MILIYGFHFYKVTHFWKLQMTLLSDEISRKPNILNLEEEYVNTEGNLNVFIKQKISKRKILPANLKIHLYNIIFAK